MTGIERIVAERNRQINREGWTAEHDEQHRDEELLIAAVCYVYNAMKTCFGTVEEWPWDSAWDKRNQHDDIRSLEIAGALIAAEIDRRLAEKES